jgi:peptidoglycan-associated lipoprotein
MNGDPTIKLLIEGHCDERGSAEFNLALGDRRAESVRGLLAQLGIDSGRIHTISFGETRPECSDATEDCWQKNRRAHIRHER